MGSRLHSYKQYWEQRSISDVFKDLQYGNPEHFPPQGENPEDWMPQAYEGYLELAEGGDRRIGGLNIKGLDG